MIRGESVRAMNRFASLTFGLCLAVVLTGCAASLSNPEDFIDGGTAPKSAEMILADSCGIGGCHDDITTAQGLDLVTPPVEDSVVDQPATAAGCESRTLVVAGDPNNSYLLDKIEAAFGICGDPMPQLGSLSENEMEILRQWIIELGDGG